MFIKRKIYELDLQNAYEDGNSDATKMWERELKIQEDYYKRRFEALKNGIKKNKKSDLIKEIDEIIQEEYINILLSRGPQGEPGNVGCIILDGTEKWKGIL